MIHCAEPVLLSTSISNTLLGQSCSHHNNSVFEIEALNNTGAAQCIMDETCFKAIPGQKIQLKQSNTFLSCTNGTEAEVIGEPEFRFKVKSSPKSKVQTNVLI